MKGLLRLNLLVSVVFVLAFVLTLFGLIRQGEKDIEREIGASIHFAEQMIEAAQYDPSRLQPLLNGNTRHIHFYLNHLPAAYDRDNDVPAWFSDLLQPKGAFVARPWRYPLMNGELLYVVATPDDEIDEVWESALMLAGLFLGGALLSNLMIFWGVRQGLKPISKILETLEQEKSGPFCTRLQHYSMPEADQLADHFNRMAEALEQEQYGNRQLTKQLMELQESERTRLAHTLHDDLGQYVTGIRAQAYMICQAADQQLVVEKTAERIVGHCDEMQKSFRHLIRDLHPVILHQLGLKDALCNLAEQWQESSGIPVKLEMANAFPELEPERAGHLYRLVQEALHNVTRHAQATVAELSLVMHGSRLQLRVIDNGCGLMPQSKPGIGMRSMHERARYLGGVLQLESVSGGGTKISLSMPVEAP
ncbi:sensor histidine kinase [Pontibacterium sp. N1Y112]|uniref:Oxygen sensor histidine kinase NreB n=1 Tax=Pontibacterium sinense TaxID=2781979 RepID=A0A8J7FPG8_9GAMM|nr:sensor histidine kinase [Pontibacterium sinense]MBE9397917.1 sensor histidine kinase [Pontibacterium sinense]